MPHSSKHHILLLSLLLLLGLSLRLFTSADAYLHEWDERYHALVAKNMLKEPLQPMLYANPVLPYDYKDWSSNHIWLHKQPLSLWLITGSFAVFGVHEWSLRLPSILLSTLSIVFTYWIAWYCFKRKHIALLAAF
ncbi:MAG: glycosyltransferase family 39 protein, partial [Bacteroidota bacterium]